MFIIYFYLKVYKASINDNHPFGASYPSSPVMSHLQRFRARDGPSRQGGHRQRRSAGSSGPGNWLGVETRRFHYTHVTGWWYTYIYRWLVVNDD